MAAAHSEPLGRINGRMPYIHNYIYFPALMGDLPAIFSILSRKKWQQGDFTGFSVTFNSSMQDKPRSSCSCKHAGLNNHNNVFYLKGCTKEKKKKITQKGRLLVLFPPSSYDQNGLPCHRRSEAMNPPPPQASQQQTGRPQSSSSF